MARTPKFKLLSLILIVAILAQLFPPKSQVVAGTRSAIAAAQPRLPRPVAGIAAPEVPEAPTAPCYATFLPGIMNASATTVRPAGPSTPSVMESPALAGPDVAIISPRDGWTISGMLWFAAQSIDLVHSVTFSAGSTVLGTDSTPDDGFQIFLDAGTLSAGTQELSVTASNPCGQTTETITVNVVPDPPGSGTVGPQGGVFASEIGSLITFPPDAVPAGTAVSVAEKSQAQTTADHGLDWDAMGVTFLGAQVVTASASISLPLAVASAGFGPRVQPGQAVVNYNILPDANGDGVDELVVVNTASVAPNDDVISDPVPQVGLISEEIQTNRRTAHILENGISGPPGTFFEIEVTGFNRFSAFGNVAIFRSAVDETEFHIPMKFIDDYEVDEIQTVLMIIPSLPPGLASFTLLNESTGSSLGPFDLTVEIPPPLTRPPDEIIDDFLISASENMDDLAAMLAGEDAFAGVVQLIDSAILHLDEARSITQAMSNDPEAEELLISMATVIENGDLPALELEIDSRRLVQSAGLCANKQQLLEAVKPSITDALDLKEVAAEAADYAAKRAYGAALGASSAYGLVSALETLAMTTVMTLVIMDCQLYGPRPASAMDSFPERQPELIVLGMGAVPPSGGSGAGNAPTLPAGDETSSLSLHNRFLEQAPGRVIVKVSSAAGSSFPFTGATDAGGYFYIPLIPQDEPFIATAVDTHTGQMRTFEGVGPVVGESVGMFFDFLSEGTGEIVELQFGQVISSSIDAPGEVDAYSFQGAAGDRVLLRAKSLDSILDPDYHRPAFEVYRPDGTLLCSSAGSFEQTCALDDNGTFTLLYSDFTSNNTGSYQLYLQRLNPPIGAHPIDFGQTVTGTVDYLIEYDGYTFNGSTGDHIIVRMSEVSAADVVNPEFRVYRPDGTLLCDSGFSSARQVEQFCVLDAPGTYAILAGDASSQNTGPYALFLQRLNNPGQTTPVAFGDIVSGTLDTAAEAHTYQFSGSTGDHVLIRIHRTATIPSGVAFWPQVRIYRPDGTELCSDYNSVLAEATCVLDVTGSYTLLASNRQGIGSYDLFIQRINNPANPTPITVGDTITQSIDLAVELDAFTFGGASGDQMLFRMTRISGDLDPHFRVYVPDGTLLCQAQGTVNVAEVVCTLNVSGTHAILVGQFDSLPRTGTYRLLIQLNN